METPKLSLPQAKVLMSSKPLTLNMAGQRAGKSFGIGLRTGYKVREFPRMVGMIAANTYKQLTQSTMVECRRVWQRYYGFTEYNKIANPDGAYVINKQPPQHFRRLHEFDSYDGIVSFRNGAVIFTASLDNYLAHDGKTLGWCELDETKDTREEAVKQVILARLSQPGLYFDQQGALRYTEKPDPDWTPFNPCVINTSPAEGVVEWLVDMFELKTFEEDIDQTIFDPQKFFYREAGSKAICIYSTFWNRHNLPSNYIDNRLEQLSAGEADKFIYGYPFSKTGGEYYPSFDRRVHVAKVPRISTLPDHLGLDFNLVPYMTLLNTQFLETDTEFQIRVCQQFCLKPPKNSTEAVCEAYLEANRGLIRDVFYYGDAMGTRGVEGFGDDFTRFNPLREKLWQYISDSSDRTTRANVGVLKRRNLMSRILEGKVHMGGKLVRLLIDDSCEELIRDLQYLKEGTNGKLKEIVTDKATGRKYEKLGHTSDALEYVICYVLEQFMV
jgi:hypothetical protein